MIYKPGLGLLGAKSNDRVHHCCIDRKAQILQYMQKIIIKKPQKGGFIRIGKITSKFRLKRQ